LFAGLLVLSGTREATAQIPLQYCFDDAGHIAVKDILFPWITFRLAWTSESPSIIPVYLNYASFTAQHPAAYPPSLKPVYEAATQYAIRAWNTFPGIEPRLTYAGSTTAEQPSWGEVLVSMSPSGVGFAQTEWNETPDCALVPHGRISKARIVFFKATSVGTFTYLPNLRRSGSPDSAPVIYPDSDA
jgi:hypothetical protein